MKPLLKLAVLLCVFAGVALSARAQEPVPPPMPVYQPLSDAQLDQLLGPIALYPDPLIAQMLPASSFPTEIVIANRYVSGGGDPNQIDQQSWDPSVQALARYPEVLQWMDQNLEWTTELGQAFLNQQQDVLDSIQRLRQSAYNFGNLQSTPQQQVVNDGSGIEIIPVDPQVIYVPVYQPDQVYDSQAAYGTPDVTFSIGGAMGPWLDCDFDWGHRNLIVWNRDQPRPANWWNERPQDRDQDRDIGHTTVWQSGSRPKGIGELPGGDRGWGNTPKPPVARPQTPRNQPVVGTVSRSFGDSAAPRQTKALTVRPEAPANRYSAPVVRTTPAPVEHVQPVSRPESNGAFIGSQSSQATRDYSNRGQQSLQTTTHSAPATHSAPVSRPAPSGGGGGRQSSGSQIRH
jgi:hypothetical protein